ncbi:hypothetical protein KY342_05390 [Candidatus Woesearchaeota archaeon]|nr:hypothetical protein [Candidatus Woesearchaeota archaeon]
MKGEFFIEYPDQIDDKGFLVYKVIYQKSEKEKPLVAKEQAVPTKGMGDNLENIIITSAVSVYRKAVAASVGLRRINGLVYWLRHLFCPYNYESLLNEAFAIGEPVIEGKQNEIFANGIARAKECMGNLFMLAEKYDSKETVEMSSVSKRELEDTQKIDFNDPEETRRASKRLFGDSLL